MAFSKAPSQDTYQTKPLKLSWMLSSRDEDTTKDGVAVNGFIELMNDRNTRDSDMIFVKRDGVSEYPLAFEENSIRGMHYWEDEDKLYIAYEDKIAVVDGSTGTLSTTLTPFTTTTGEVGFTEFYYEDGSTKLVVGDGEDLITIDNANTVVTVTDADLPTPFKPQILFLDGYIFLVKEGTADIYNSALNNPTSWVPGDFITAEMLPDTLIRIARLNNYVIAMGSTSIEYFFDAGNASGSPLQRNDTPVKQVGYLGGFATHGNKIYFIGSTSTTGPEMYILEDFKMDTLNAAPLRRALRTSDTYLGAIVTNGGHDFYVLSLDGQTLVYDVNTKLWFKWKWQETARFPISYSVQLYLDNVGFTSVFAMDGITGLYAMDASVHQDDNVNFTMSVQTVRENFDTLHDKFVSRALISGDNTTGDVMLSYSDDDFATFSTPRAISMSSRRKVLHRLGRGRERSYRLTYTHNDTCRLGFIELDYNIGKR